MRKEGRKVRKEGEVRIQIVSSMTEVKWKEIRGEKYVEEDKNKKR